MLCVHLNHSGAGKSSLLNILSGEFAPTSGDAFISGTSLITDVDKCRKHIGFCPQFDALYDLLTAREHLRFYAAVKGIPPQAVEAAVELKLREMGLLEYADRATGGYSGGNKRKLSVAMAMIGDPTIVFLDGEEGRKEGRKSKDGCDKAHSCINLLPLLLGCQMFYW